VLLFIRSMFSLIPGVEGLSGNIRAFSMVDKFLEHSRMLVFCSGGEDKMYITSADLMPRNLDRRVEVTCPVYDPDLKEELRSFLRLQLEDNVKTRILDKDLANLRVPPGGNKRSRAQWSIYDYLKKISVPPRSRAMASSRNAQSSAPKADDGGPDHG